MVIQTNVFLEISAELKRPHHPKTKPSTARKLSMASFPFQAAKPVRPHYSLNSVT
jgi:hypothetical protein